MQVENIISGLLKSIIYIPGSLLGMLLFLLLLFTKIVKTEQIEESSEFLLNNMGFFYVQLGIGLLNSMKLFSEVWMELIVVLVLSCVLIMFVTSKVTLNPVLVTIRIMVACILIFHIPYDVYEKQTSIITYMLSPIIIFLAVPIYKNRDKIGENLIPIVVGIFSGIMTSILSVYALGRLFKLDEKIIESIYAKSITTPLALEETKMVDGIEGLTIVAVLVTGVSGATLAPIVMKLGKVKNDIAKGIGIGVASHGVGTSKAVEISVEAGGASGLAMAITGVLTVIIASILLR